MSRFIEIKLNNDEVCKVYPRWKGNNLAVHAPVVNCEVERSDYWIITHLPTGYRAGIMYSVKRAIKLAREWDELFDSMDANCPRDWVMVDDWKAAVDCIPSLV